MRFVLFLLCSMSTGIVFASPTFLSGETELKTLSAQPIKKIRYCAMHGSPLYQNVLSWLYYEGDVRTHQNKIKAYAWAKLALSCTDVNAYKQKKYTQAIYDSLSKHDQYKAIYLANTYKKLIPKRKTIPKECQA